MVVKPDNDLSTSLPHDDYVPYIHVHDPNRQEMEF